MFSVCDKIMQRIKNAKNNKQQQTPLEIHKWSAIRESGRAAEEVASYQGFLLALRLKVGDGDWEKTETVKDSGKHHHQFQFGKEF